MYWLYFDDNRTLWWQSNVCTSTALRSHEHFRPWAKNFFHLLHLFFTRKLTLVIISNFVFQDSLLLIDSNCEPLVMSGKRPLWNAGQASSLFRFWLFSTHSLSTYSFLRHSSSTMHLHWRHHWNDQIQLWIRSLSILSYWNAEIPVEVSRSSFQLDLQLDWFDGQIQSCKFSSSVNILLRGF